MGETTTTKGPTPAGARVLEMLSANPGSYISADGWWCDLVIPGDRRPAVASRQVMVGLENGGHVVAQRISRWETWWSLPSAAESSDV